MAKLGKHDKLFFISFLPSALAVSGILLVFLLVMYSQSLKSLETFGFNLYLNNFWNPEKEVYGVLSPIVGTFVTSAIATIVSLFLSIPLTITIAELLKGRVRDVFSSVVELMGGMPTIIYAVWSLNYLAPFLKDYVMVFLHRYLGFIPLFSCNPVTGLSLFTAGVAIGIALTPYTTSIIVESYKMIPMMYREACLGIGATRFETTRILISLTKPAIVAAAVLSFARAAGETTIAAATVGNSMMISLCLFSPGYTVSALIASQYANAGLYVYAESVLYAAALVVLVATLILSFIGVNALSRWRERIVV